MRKHNYLFIGLALVLCGCDEPRKTDKLEVTPAVAAPTNQVEKVEQFVVTSKGTFKAGYDNTVREIFILKDTRTGVEYIGVTDCTLIKRIQAKKEEAVDSAVDTALDIVDAFSE